MAEEYTGPEDAYEWLPWDDTGQDRVKRAQTFTAESTHSIGEVKFKGYKDAISTTDGKLDLSIQALDENGKPDGVELVGGYLSFGDIPYEANKDWVTIVLDSVYEITNTTKYALVLTVEDGEHEDAAFNIARVNSNEYANGERQSYWNGTWTIDTSRDFLFIVIGFPSKPTTPAPEDEERDVRKTTENLTWADGGNTDTFNIHFGTTSGDLVELETGLDVNTPTWTAPFVAIEINDYNPPTGSGYRSPIIGDTLSYGDTYYDITDVERGKLVDVQYWATLYAFRTGPPLSAGTVLTNGVAPDPENPQAVSVTLNDSLFFTGDVETAFYPYATRYYWRIDAVNENGTTTGDEWYFDVEQSWLNERLPDYDEDKQWGYSDGEYQWSDDYVAGGGRYQQQLVVVGHNTIYYKSL